MVNSEEGRVSLILNIQPFGSGLLPESDYLPSFDEADYTPKIDFEYDSIERPDDKTKLEDKVTDNYCIITPKDLFDKLNLCEVNISDFKLNLSREVIHDLSTAQIIEQEPQMMDVGWISKAILVYVEEVDAYRRVILLESGNSERVNQSKYTDVILNSM